MIDFRNFKKNKKINIIILTFVIHFLFSLTLFAFFIPYFFYKKLNFRKKNKILIVNDFYRTDGVTRHKYDIDITLKNFLKREKKNYDVEVFYTDLNQDKIIPFNFLKVFFSSQPKVVIAPIDYGNYSYDLNYILFIFIKYIFKSKIVGIANDPIWAINFLRYKLCLNFFDAQIAWPYIFINKQIYSAPQNILHKENLKKKKIIPKENKTIDVCYIGRRFGNRDRILEFLKSQGINVKKFGTGYKQSIDADNFHKILSQSKIVVNFSRNSGLPNPEGLIYPFTCRGRIFEAAAASCLMFDERNKDLEIFFKPFKEYIPYKTKEDLSLKIKHYLKYYNEIGYGIALRAYLKNSKFFSPHYFWDRLFKKLYL